MSIIQLVDVGSGTNSGNVVPDLMINCYSSLSIPAYWRAMNFIASNMARFPRSVRDPNAKDGDPKHRLTRILNRRPNSYQNPFTFWQTFFFHFAHTANGYAWVERVGGDGLAVAFHNLPPDQVTPFRYWAEGSNTPEQFYLLHKTKTVIAGANMLHVAGLAYDGTKGTDAVALHEGTFQRASIIDRYASKFLQKGTVIRGAVEIPGDVPEDKLELMKNYIKTNFTGVDGVEDVLILTFGGKFNNQTLNPQQSQMVEQARHSTKQISQITGVPPEFLFELGEAKYNAAIDAAGEFVVRYCFGPLIEQVEDELNMKLLTDEELDRGLSVKLNPDALIRGSTKDQMTVIKTGIDAGVWTPNDGREMTGMPKSNDPEADKLKRSGDTAAKLDAGKKPDEQNPPENPAPNA